MTLRKRHSLVLGVAAGLVRRGGRPCWACLLRRCPRSCPGSADRCARGWAGPALWPGSGAAVHDAVVAAAGAGAAGAGAVRGEHLRGGPAVEFHQVPFGSAAVQPGVAEVVPDPVRVHRYPALPAAAGDDLVDAGRSQRPPVMPAQEQRRVPVAMAVGGVVGV